MSRALPPGITGSPAKGYLARVSVGPRKAALVRAKRFPPYTIVSEMEEWQEGKRVELRNQAPITFNRGTLGADAPRYLELVGNMPTIKDEARYITRWVSIYGELPRDQVTHVHVASQLERWRLKHGWSASYLNHHRSALSGLYTRLDGKEERNPCRAVPEYDEPDALPNDIRYSIIRRTFDAMNPTITKARLETMAFTGISPAELMRVQESDILLQQRGLIARARRKGGGYEPRTIPLTNDATRSLRALIRFDKLSTAKEPNRGHFSTSTVRRDWRLAYGYARTALLARWKTRFGDRGVQRLKDVWPADPPNPYRLRHSYLTVAFRVSGDERSVRELAGHSNPRTTRRYTLAAVPPRLQEIRDKIQYTVGSQRRIGSGKS